MTDYERHLFKTIHWSSEESKALFDEFTAGLPMRSKDTPYHSGPHNVSRMSMALACIKPESVLEIGFNLGHGAAILFGLNVRRVISMQPSKDAKTQAAIELLTKLYPEDFDFIQSDTRTLLHDDLIHGQKKPPDLMFIDGDHSYEWAMSDIAFGLKIGVRDFLMDDYDSHHGPGVIKAVEDSNLVVRALFGTMAWCTTTEGLALRHDPEATE